MQVQEKTQTPPERADGRALLLEMELCGHFLYHCRGRRLGQARLLRMLAEHGQLTQRRLQELLHIQSGSMSEIVGKLECSGLLERERSQKDRRQVLLRITAAGRQALAQHEQENREQESRLFAVLSDEEQRQLLALLQKLSADWRSQYDRALFNHCSPKAPNN